jgi:heme-degrading monooxygenase HmoA
MTATIHSITDRTGGRMESGYLSNEDQVTSYRGFTTAPEPPLAVFSSFLVSPGDATAWIRIWQKLASTAETWPGCRSFRLVRDRNDDMYIAVFSEWDDLEAYRSFMRETGDRWLQGAVGHTVLPAESRYLEVISDDSPMRVAH